MSSDEDELREIASDSSFERSISKPHESALPSDYSSSGTDDDDESVSSADNVGIQHNTARKLAIKAMEKSKALLMEKKKMIARSTVDEGVEVSIKMK